jgi:hypothetical protein
MANLTNSVFHVREVLHEMESVFAILHGTVSPFEDCINCGRMELF